MKKNNINKDQSLKDEELEPLVLELSQWYKAQGEFASLVLPQNLPEQLLHKLHGEARKCLENQAHSGEALLTAVGLIKGGGKEQFKASREDLVLYVRAYSFNLVIESLKRLNLLTYDHPFALDDVLDISFERDFKLTDFGRTAATKAGSSLGDLVSQLSSGLH